MTAPERPLGLLPPTDDRHRILYALTEETLPRVPTSFVLATPWYANFDKPVAMQEKGHTVYYIGIGDLGRPRGGHAICSRSPYLTDLKAWAIYYNQRKTSQCVGYSVCRTQTHANRARYDAQWVYLEAQKIDEWPGTNYQGTSLRAGLDVARDVGMRVVRAGKSKAPDLAHGISENRWAFSVEDAAACQSPADNGLIILNRGWFALNQSWGLDDYEHEVRLPCDIVYRLLQEDAEISVITDRP